MKLIETKTLGSAAASIEFTSIPQDGTDLVAVVAVRSSSSAAVATQLNVQFNASGGTAYSDRFLTGSGSAASSGSRSSQAVFRVTAIPTSIATANTFGNACIYIPNYTATTTKSVSADAVTETNGTEAYQEIVAALWNNTAAITSVAFTAQDGTNLAIGSTISLYKITKGTDGIVVVS